MQKFEKGIAMLIGCQVIWGISPVVIGLFLATVPAAYLLTIRHIIGGLFLLGVLRWLGLRFTIERGQWRRVALWSIITSGLADFFWVLALQHAGVIISILLVRLEIPLGVVFARWYLHERVTPTMVLATLFSIGGVVILSLNNSPLSNQNLLGQGIIEGVIAALLWTWAGVYAKKLLTQGTSALSLSTARIFIGGLFNVLLAWISVPLLPTTISLTANAWGALIFLGIAASGIGYMLYYKGMELTSASVAAILLSVSLLIATLGGLAIGERLQPVQWIGAGMILAAIVLTSNIHESLRRIFKLPQVTS